MIVVPFKKEHMQNIMIQSSQRDCLDFDSVDLYLELEQFESFTAIDEDGTILGCAGVVNMNRHRALAWSYLSYDLKHKMVAMTRAVKRFLDLSKYGRIEMHVSCDVKEDHRWAKMLGFECECERMRNFSPDGRDYALYVRLK